MPGKSNNTKKSIRFLIIIIAQCIIFTIIMMSLAGIKILKEPVYDIIKVRNVLDVMNSKLDYDDPPIIDYSDYGEGRSRTQNCKDWAFSFAVLYGHEAKVIFSYDHAFIKIGNDIIEPQQSSRNFRISYRIEDVSYYQYEKIKVLSKHKREIRRYFNE